MRSAMLWSSLLLVILVETPVAYACVCAGRVSTPEAFAWSSAVFRGRVTRVTRSPENYSDRTTQFIVDKWWKGSGLKHVTLVSTGSSCDFGFLENTTYFVYAGWGEADVLTAEYCSRTSIVAENPLEEERLDDLVGADLLRRYREKEWKRTLPVALTLVGLSGLVASIGFVRWRRRAQSRLR